MNNNKKKKAVLVVGSEGSGTRLITSILCHNGFLGSSEHHQPFDDRPPFEDNIVWRRSVPHANIWDGVGQFDGSTICGMTQCLNVLKENDYKTTLIIMMRDWNCVVESNIKQNLHDETQSRFFKLQMAYYSIFSNIAQPDFNTPFVLINYEAMILNEYDYLEKILSPFSIKIHNKSVVIKNENTKYYH